MSGRDFDRCGRARVCIVTVGSELVTGRIADTNAQWIAAELESSGFEVVLVLSVDDDPAGIADVLRIARDRCSVVFVVGGMGPTPDDITVGVVAAELHRRLVEDAGTVARLKERYARRGMMGPSPSGMRQALVPEGSEVFANPVGSAPGLWIDDGAVTFVILPGVPDEMKALVTEYVLPRLAALSSVACRGRIYRVVGMPESAVGESVQDIWECLGRDEKFALELASGEVLLRVSVSGPNEDCCTRRLDELDLMIRSRLGDHLAAIDRSSLAGEAVAMLDRRGLTVAVAESLSGGLIMARLSSVPGASRVLLGGWVTYQEETKVNWLGVPREVVEENGAVSEQVAGAMASRARDQSGASVALATTGWAGPGGGTWADPVGTVYVGIATPAGTSVRRCVFGGSRDNVREHAAVAALDMLRRWLDGSE